MLRFTAHFDGKALIPDESVELEEGREYAVVLTENGRDGEEGGRFSAERVPRRPADDAGTAASEPDDLFDFIASVAEDLGPPDLSERLEEYTRRKLLDD